MTRLLLCAALLGTPALAQEVSLTEAWGDQLRRLRDRQGRPNPDGSLLQWAAPLQYGEYILDLAVSAFPAWGEAAWARRKSGARFYLQSLNEFTFVSAVQLKQQAHMGDVATLDLRFDRVQSRDTQSDLFTLRFGFPDIAGTPFFAAISVTPRWEKTDIDVEGEVGVRLRGVGAGRLRIGALDTFNDAAYALAEGRGAEVDERRDQDGPQWLVTAEAASVEWRRLRAEIYGGALLDASIAYTYPKDQTLDFTHRSQGLLAGGLLEWHLPDLPIRVAGSVLHIATEDTFTGPNPQILDEGRTQTRLHVLIRAAATLHLDLESAWTQIHRLGDEVKKGGQDHRWLTSARAYWMPHPNVGAELRLMRVDRRKTGGPKALDERTHHRLITRCVLQLGSDVWTAFGVGWDLDPEDGLYDGGGMTMIVNL